MTFDDIETALGVRLAGLPDCPPIAWPNKESSHGRPYLRVMHAPVSREVAGIDCGSAPDQVGIFLVTVVAESDNFTAEANEIAQDVSDRFPMGLRLSAGDGVVLIDKPAEIVQGYHDRANDWNTPVRVRYRTEI